MSRQHTLFSNRVMSLITSPCTDGGCLAVKPGGRGSVGQCIKALTPDGRRGAMWGSRDGGYCLLWMCVLGTTSLNCYSCSGSDQNSSCLHDANGMMESMVNYGGVYSKDCDLEINQTMCVIETSASSGDVKTIIRGCSNGYTFSFTDIKLFQGLSPTNQTTCAVYSGMVVCLTLCDQSYCNGPQHFVDSSTSSTHFMSRIVVFVLCLYNWII